MVRMYSGTVFQIQAIIGALKDRMPEADINELIQRVDIAPGGENYPRTLAELEDVIQKQSEHAAEVNQEGQPAYGDLLDKLVAVSRLPYLYNILGTSFARALRRVLLIPSEVDSLNQALQESEWRCGGCGVGMATDSIATLGRHGDNKAILYCLRCRFPQVTLCHGSKHTLPISKKSQVVLEKLVSGCEACELEKKIAEGNTPPVVGPQPGRALGQALPFQTFQGGVRTGRTLRQNDVQRMGLDGQLHNVVTFDDGV